ncbi:MAG: hypothetical protein CMC57_07430 [Flavobacteriaceae bacterium]|nr:hypothetical protein [Flavobacteriaceae bacterium]
MEIIINEKLTENAKKLGTFFREKINAYIKNSQLIKLVRGKGLLNAIVVNDSKRNTQTAWNICLRLKENGLLAKPTHGNIIRFAPPLVINTNQMNECISIIIDTIKEFEKD